MWSLTSAIATPPMITVAHANAVETKTIATPTASPSEIVIAVVGPQANANASKPFVSATERIAAAATAFVAAINQSDGLLGKKLRVIIVDDGCDRTKAETVARDLVQQRVALVLGHPCIHPALAAADVYGRENILFIATANRHPALTAKRSGPTVFRLDGRDDRQGEAAGAILAQLARSGPVAIIHDRTAYARALADAAEATVKTLSGSAAITATIVGGDKDYPLVVKKVREAKAIFFAGFPMEAGFLFTALRDAGSRAVFIGSDSLATTELAATFAADAKGVRVLLAAGLTPLGTPSALPAVAATPTDVIITAKIDATASPSTAAALTMFGSALVEAQSTDGAALAAALTAKAYATQLGPIRFSATGDATIASFEVWEWTGTAWAEAPPNNDVVAVPRSAQTTGVGER